jgi:hypothetical protein
MACFLQAESLLEMYHKLAKQNLEFHTATIASTKSSLQNTNHHKRPITALSSSQQQQQQQQHKEVVMVGHHNMSQSTINRMLSGIAEDELTSEQIGSKRAKKMMQLSSGSSKPLFTSSKPILSTGIDEQQNNENHPNSSSSSSSIYPPPPPKLNILTKLRELEKVEHIIGKSSNNNNNHSTNKKVQNIVKCAVCFTSEEILRAECGHVCCKSCWLQQLKIKAICPICRQPTEQAQLFRIRIITSAKIT